MSSHTVDIKYFSRPYTNNDGNANQLLSYASFTTSLFKSKAKIICQAKIYIFVLEGQVEVDGVVLQRRDGMGVTNGNEVTVHATADSEVLAIEVPMFA